MSKTIFIHCPNCKRATLHARELFARAYICVHCRKHQHIPKRKAWREGGTT